MKQSSSCSPSNRGLSSSFSFLTLPFFVSFLALAFAAWQVGHLHFLEGLVCNGGSRHSKWKKSPHALQDTISRGCKRPGADRGTHVWLKHSVQALEPCWMIAHLHFLHRQCIQLLETALCISLYGGPDLQSAIQSVFASLSTIMRVFASPLSTIMPFAWRNTCSSTLPRERDEF